MTVFRTLGGGQKKINNISHHLRLHIKRQWNRKGKKKKKRKQYVPQQTFGEKTNVKQATLTDGLRRGKEINNRGKANQSYLRHQRVMIKDTNASLLRRHLEEDEQTVVQMMNIA